MKAVIGLAIGVCLLGSALFWSGLREPIYRNPAEFQQRYSLLGPGMSKEFHELRRASFSSSIPQQDYGITLIAIGVALPWIVRWRKSAPYLPRRKWTTVLLGQGAALATVASEVGSLFLDFSRGEFPWWADSLGIPLVGMPFVFVGLSIWAGGLSRLHGRQAGGSAGFGFQAAGVVLASLTVVTGAQLLFVVGHGDFLALVPAALWLGFYSALLRSRRVQVVRVEH